MPTAGTISKAPRDPALGAQEFLEKMTTGSFPIDPGRRKAVLVLQQYDLEKCTYEPGAAQALLDDEAFVLQFPICSEGNAPAALQNICDSGLARPGCVLVQSPYDPDTYEDASLAP